MLALAVGVILAVCDPALAGTIIEWDPPNPTHVVCNGVEAGDDAEFYTIERFTVSTGTGIRVWNSSQHPEPKATGYVIAGDEPPAREGTLYRYEIRSWDYDPAGIPRPSPCGVAAVLVCAGPLLCIVNDGTSAREVQCYPGATCKLPGPMGCKP